MEKKKERDRAAKEHDSGYAVKRSTQSTSFENLLRYLHCKKYIFFLKLNQLLLCVLRKIVIEMLKSAPYLFSGSKEMHRIGKFTALQFEALVIVVVGLVSH